jgi:hypothetical protein
VKSSALSEGRWSLVCEFNADVMKERGASECLISKHEVSLMSVHTRHSRGRCCLEATQTRLGPSALRAPTPLPAPPLLRAAHVMPPTHSAGAAGASASADTLSLLPQDVKGYQTALH